MVKIIVDSTCDIPESLMKRFGIAVLPLCVTIDGIVYRDGIDIGIDEVYAAMRSGKMPTTSQVPWQDVYNLFTSLAECGDDFLYLAFSSAMSGTFDLANLVISELRDTYPARRMETVDSRGGSMGAGIIAIQLGLMNERGADIDEMIGQATWMARHVKYSFTLDDLRWALQGGRLSARTVGSIGSLLKINPVLDVKDGALHLSKLVRGTKQSLSAVVNQTVYNVATFGDQIIGMTYTEKGKASNAVYDLLQRSLPQCTLLCQRIGSVLGSHLGIGGVGVFCMDRRPDGYLSL